VGIADNTVFTKSSQPGYEIRFLFQPGSRLAIFKTIGWIMYLGILFEVEWQAKVTVGELG
jgi:hypothetical protein